MKTYFLFLGLLLYAKINAQELLTSEEAVNIALKNNYDILIARNDADIARINNTPGNAGMLPSVAITGSEDYSESNINQKQANGNIISSPRAKSNTLTAAAELNWTLFDGGRMFIVKKRLTQQDSLGQIQFRDQVLQTVYNVIAAYYDVARQMQQLTSIREVIAYNKENVKISQTMFDAGLTPKTTLLQAKIDLNVYLEDSIDQQAAILTSKRALNVLLSRDAEAAFTVSDSIPLNYKPNRGELMEKAAKNNTTILAYQKQAEVARLTIKEFNALRFPRLDVSGGYNLSQTDNSAGNLLRNHSYGPVIGASATIPIFQGGNNIRQVKTAQLQFKSANFDLENIKLQINEQLFNALTDFDHQQELLTIEKGNVILAKENLEIALGRLRLGQTTTLEVRQAQESFVDAHTRLTNFEFNLKIAETKLKQLIAEL